MKLHLHDLSGQNAITGHGAGYVQVNGTRIETSVWITPTAIESPWSAPALETLRFSDFDELLKHNPSIVVLGVGPVFKFPQAAVVAAFSQARIGFEVMDTGAACRTYNVLMSEGRNVAAALYV
jgi:uncharacterized protein